MINPRQFVELLNRFGLTFFAGVPDSLLKSFCRELEGGSDAHTAANEGNAVAMAAGYHLATGHIAVCYMQNSGLGNAFNPLMSLAHPEVYSIPILLLVGWRGAPGVSDEPQHRAQGKATADTLKTLGIDHAILPDTLEAAEAVLTEALATLTSTSKPFAFLVRKNTFEPSAVEPKSPDDSILSREAALHIVISKTPAEARFVATTGMLSRELFELREIDRSGHARDFLTVGSMGHASSIALGLALNSPERTVVCLDGDGAALMHMGALATIGAEGPPNLYHIIFNNGAHDSVGGQATVARKIDLSGVARACGYRSVWRVATPEELAVALGSIFKQPGPALIEILVGRGARDNLGRPTSTPRKNKADFMNGMS
jgi:phosphonopyruvate decarboxylase